MVAIKNLHINILPPGVAPSYGGSPELVQTAMDTMSGVNLVTTKFVEQYLAHRPREMEEKIARRETQMKGIGAQTVTSHRLIQLDIHFRGATPQENWSTDAWCAEVDKISGDIQVLLGFPWLCEHGALINMTQNPVTHIREVSIDIYQPGYALPNMNERLKKMGERVQQIMAITRLRIPTIPDQPVCVAAQRDAKPDDIVKEMDRRSIQSLSCNNCPTNNYEKT